MFESRVGANGPSTASINPDSLLTVNSAAVRNAALQELGRSTDDLSGLNRLARAYSLAGRYSRSAASHTENIEAEDDIDIDGEFNPRVVDPFLSNASLAGISNRGTHGSPSGRIQSSNAFVDALLEVPLYANTLAQLCGFSNPCTEQDLARIIEQWILHDQTPTLMSKCPLQFDSVSIARLVKKRLENATKDCIMTETISFVMCASGCELVVDPQNPLSCTVLNLPDGACSAENYVPGWVCKSCRGTTINKTSFGSLFQFVRNFVIIPAQQDAMSAYAADFRAGKIGSTVNGYSDVFDGLSFKTLRESLEQSGSPLTPFDVIVGHNTDGTEMASNLSGWVSFFKVYNFPPSLRVTADNIFNAGLFGGVNTANDLSSFFIPSLLQLALASKYGVLCEAPLSDIYPGHMQDQENSFGYVRRRIFCPWLLQDKGALIHTCCFVGSSGIRGCTFCNMPSGHQFNARQHGESQIRSIGAWDGQLTQSSLPDFNGFLRTPIVINEVIEMYRENRQIAALPRRPRGVQYRDLGVHGFRENFRITSFMLIPRTVFPLLAIPIDFMHEMSNIYSNIHQHLLTDNGPWRLFTSTVRSKLANKFLYNIFPHNMEALPNLFEHTNSLPSTSAKKQVIIQHFPLLVFGLWSSMRESETDDEGASGAAAGVDKVSNLSLCCALNVLSWGFYLVSYKGALSDTLLTCIQRSIFRAYVILSRWFEQHGKATPSSVKLILHFCDSIRIFGPMVATALWSLERKIRESLRDQTSNKYAISSSMQNTRRRALLQLRAAVLERQLGTFHSQLSKARMRYYATLPTAAADGEDNAADQVAFQEDIDIADERDLRAERDLELQLDDDLPVSMPAVFDELDQESQLVNGNRWSNVCNYGKYFFSGEIASGSPEYMRIPDQLKSDVALKQLLVQKNIWQPNNNAADILPQHLRTSYSVRYFKVLYDRNNVGNEEEMRSSSSSKVVHSIAHYLARTAPGRHLESKETGKVGCIRSCYVDVLYQGVNNVPRRAPGASFFYCVLFQDNVAIDAFCLVRWFTTSSEDGVVRNRVNMSKDILGENAYNQYKREMKTYAPNCQFYRKNGTCSISPARIARGNIFLDYNIRGATNQETHWMPVKSIMNTLSIFPIRSAARNNMLLSEDDVIDTKDAYFFYWNPFDPYVKILVNFVYFFYF